jgi:cardiolipin synthase A/B
VSSARRSLHLLDHKLSDPDLVALLRERRNAGVDVALIGKKPVGSLVPHGKLLIIDGSRAVLGSMAMSALSLDFRREVSVVVEEAAAVALLNEFYGELRQRSGGSASALPGDAAA